MKNYKYHFVAVLGGLLFGTVLLYGYYNYAIHKADTALVNSAEVLENFSPLGSSAMINAADQDEVRSIEVDDAGGVEFILELMPLLSRWDIDVVKPYLSPETKSQAEHLYSEVFPVLENRLGAVLTMAAPEIVKSPAVSTIDPGSDAQLIPYKFNADFEHAMAEVNLVLMRQGSAHYLHSFTIIFPA